MFNAKVYSLKQKEGEKNTMKNSKLMLIALLSASLVLSACGGNKNNNNNGNNSSNGGGDSSGDSSGSTPDTPKSYTYHTYTSVSPSNWNELTYKDNNDTLIGGRIGGSFFTFNYKFEEGHYGERDHIIDGDFTVEYDGATKLEDITASYAGNANWKVPADATEGLVYKITLRDDLKWEDGTSIDARDFAYSMKRMLDPEYLNFRADDQYQGSLKIHNAEKYLKQGQSGYFQASSCYDAYDASLDANLFFSGDEKYQDIHSKLYDDIKAYTELSDAGMAYYGIGGIIDLLTEGAISFEIGEFEALEGKSLAQIKANNDLLTALSKVATFYGYIDGSTLGMFVANYTFPKMDYENNVGVFANPDNNLELILVLDKTLMLLEKDGSLAFKAAYNLGSLPLVNKTLYEKNEHDPVEGATLKTSTYCSSLESTISWGPYKLTYFEAGKQFILEKNDYWYGYNMDSYKGQYQTTRIVTDIIAEWNTAWQQFQQGDLASIGMDVSIAQDYNKSSRAYFSGDDYIYTLQIQSSAEALANAETAGVDKEILNNVNFRQAISLSINRSEFAAATTTASRAGLGLFNMYHYYDIEHGKQYRAEDDAKRAICEVYGTNVEDYDSLDAAYNATTGYNLDLAKSLVNKAYDEQKAAGKISDTDVVTLVYGSSVDSSTARRYYDNFKAALLKMVEGTKLDGRLVINFNGTYGEEWEEQWNAGAYDFLIAGWSGAALDPGFFLAVYIQEQYKYATGWDTSAVKMTLNPWGDEADGHKELNMSLVDWYNCLNGNDGAAYDWSEGKVDNSMRVRIIAALECEILKSYYAVPLMYWYGATILSYQLEYASPNDNVILGFGGLRYMTYNYDDDAWVAVKASFDYKK